MAHQSPLALVIDDERDVRDMIRLSLQYEGWRVKTASNGREALESLQEEFPSIIIVDLMLPYMSGIEICHKLLPDKRMANVPVLLVSGVNAKAKVLDDFWDLPLRYKDFLSKPFLPDQFLDKVEGILPPSRGRMSSSGRPDKSKGRPAPGAQIPQKPIGHAATEPLFAPKPASPAKPTPNGQNDQRRINPRPSGPPTPPPWLATAFSSGAQQTPVPDDTLTRRAESKARGMVPSSAAMRNRNKANNGAKDESAGPSGPPTPPPWLATSYALGEASDTVIRRKLKQQDAAVGHPQSPPAQRPAQPVNRQPVQKIDNSGGSVPTMPSWMLPSPASKQAKPVANPEAPAEPAISMPAPASPAPAPADEHIAAPALNHAPQPDATHFSIHADQIIVVSPGDSQASSPATIVVPASALNEIREAARPEAKAAAPNPSPKAREQKPTPAPDATSGGKAPAESFRPKHTGYKILLIDDDPDLLFIFKTAMSPWHVIQTAENGMEGLLALDSFEPDFVVTDQNMPVLNGLETAEAIRRHPTLCRVPVFFLTGESDKQLPRKVYDVGGNLYLRKPLDPFQLIKYIDYFLTETKALPGQFKLAAPLKLADPAMPPEPANPAAAPAAPAVRILAVDFNIEDHQLLKRMFGEIGEEQARVPGGPFELLWTEDPTTALGNLVRWQPDLILYNPRNPGIDGVAFAQMLRLRKSEDPQARMVFVGTRFYESDLNYSQKNFGMGVIDLGGANNLIAYNLSEAVAGARQQFYPKRFSIGQLQQEESERFTRLQIKNARQMRELQTFKQRYQSIQEYIDNNFKQ